MWIFLRLNIRLVFEAPIEALDTEYSVIITRHWQLKNRYFVIHVIKIKKMNNKKPPVPQCPSVPVEEEIEEDLKAIDETETPLLTGNNNFVFIACFGYD